MKTDPEAQTPEGIFQDFLRCQVEERLEFESLLARHPDHAHELRRLRASLPVPPASHGADSVFCLASPRERFRILPDDDLQVGRHIGGFELIERIGSGGMGEVWEARQSALDRRVALKFIRPDHVTKTMVERFHVEARAGGRLNHPNIVALHDHGRSEGRYWIAQELVEGGCTLADTVQSLKEEERLPAGYYRKVAELFVAVADGLQTAHEAGVVHRDLKPQNILITPQDVPKVGDFGLARIVDDAPLTVGQAGGTPHYMSPEQVDPGPEPIDGRSDVFSLGAVLYELLTFRRAFGGPSSVSVLHRIVSVDPEHPRKIDPRIPDELAVIALAALEKRRADRYQTMRELASDLRRFLRDEPILRRPDTVWTRLCKWRRRNPARAAALALGGLLLLTAGVLVDQRERARRATQQGLLVEALREIDHGRLDDARQLSRRALELYPDDPTPHVYLAQGFARYSRFAEAEQELALARDKGLRERTPVDDVAEEHLTYGLYRLLDGKSRGWREAERHLARAHELDPDLEGPLFPLYQVRRALGDDAGAREPLGALARKLTPDDPFSVVVGALQLALEGRLAESTERLEGLRTLAPEERRALRLRRLLGGNYVRMNRWREARKELEGHLEGFPDDPKALDLLARAHWGLALEAGGTPAVDLHLASALRLAERAAEHDPSWAQPHALLCELWLERLAQRPDLYRAPPVEWTDALERHLAEWQRRDPGSEAPEAARGQLSFLLALVAQGVGDGAEERRLLEECLDARPDHFRAAVLLAERLWHEGDEAQEALDLLARADEAWSEADDPDRRWRLAIDVWTFGHADRRGALDVAADALAAARSHAWSAEAQWRELLTLAEFLALARSPELQDCGEALRLIEDWRLPDAVSGQADGERLLAAILERCG